MKDERIQRVQRKEEQKQKRTQSIQKIIRFAVTFWKFAKYVMFGGMLLLIYLVSPHITATIQNGAKYLYELDSNYITRVVELILAVTLVLAVSITKNSNERRK